MIDLSSGRWPRIVVLIGDHVDIEAMRRAVPEEQALILPGSADVPVGADVVVTTIDVLERRGTAALRASGGRAPPTLVVLAPGPAGLSVPALVAMVQRLGETYLRDRDGSPPS